MKLFVEGGGDKKNPEARDRLRAGYSALLQRAGIDPLPQIIACGSGGDALREFKLALDGKIPVMLLVDSESAVSPENFNRPWLHLAERKRDRWEKPEGASDEDVCLMAQCMEAWILADPKTLAEHYGVSRDELSELDGLNVEDVSPSRTVKDHLNSVAQKGGRSKYHKTRDGFALIGIIDPSCVAERAPHAKRFFDTLQHKLDVKTEPKKRSKL